jgi:hypothetical protein
MDGGVEFSPDIICVFDGVQSALDRCQKWYEERLSEATAAEAIREEQRGHHEASEGTTEVRSAARLPRQAQIPEGVQVYVSEPIVDRKSSFIGRACRISDPSQVGYLIQVYVAFLIFYQVPLILAFLMGDHRIARAAHPIINAWRCQVGTLVHQDNDDDGETAAGGRLAHLLHILVRILLRVIYLYSDIYQRKSMTCWSLSLDTLEAFTSALIGSSISTRRQGMPWSWGGSWTLLPVQRSMYRVTRNDMGRFTS